MNDDNIQKAQNVPPFVRYVASTIPMVFDNSLSYYEALGALAKSLQDTVDVINNNATVTEEYIQLTKDMQEYMDHYFDNLDVQEEINNKLDEMVTSGQLQQLIDAYFAQVSQRISDLNIEVDQRLDAQDESIRQVTNTTNTKLASQDGDIQTLESRMDAFSSLTEGSTTGDAELIDGRISFDGKVFSSIGDNIRNYQKMGFTDITASLTVVDGKYIGKNTAENPSSGFKYYTLPTDKDKLYLIDTNGHDFAPQIVYGRSYSIPATVNSSGNYTDVIILKGTGGNIYVNNLKTNTHVFIGELAISKTPSDTATYFTDITTECEVKTGHYRNASASEVSNADFNYYTIDNLTIGKIYRIYTSPSTHVPVAVQENGMCFPTNPSTLSGDVVPTYYDVYCTSDTPIYINEHINNMVGGSVKIYESVFTYTTSAHQNIKSDVGAFDKAFFIGDSLTYGQTYTSSSTTYRNYYNYPYYLKKLLQINEITEVARSGATSQSWWNSFNDQITQTDTCYFIWLGTNDNYTDTVATDCAGDDYTQFAETATGYLGKIVGKVASLTNVKIVMLNNFATVGTKATNNKVINDIATKFGALVIDINNTNVSDSGYHTAYNGYYNSVHFNNQGHNYVANIVANNLMTYMNTHKGSFELYKVHA